MTVGLGSPATGAAELTLTIDVGQGDSTVDGALQCHPRIQRVDDGDGIQGAGLTLPAGDDSGFVGESVALVILFDLQFSAPRARADGHDTGTGQRSGLPEIGHRAGDLQRIVTEGRFTLRLGRRISLCRRIFQQREGMPDGLARLLVHRCARSRQRGRQRNGGGRAQTSHRRAPVADRVRLSRRCRCAKNAARTLLINLPHPGISPNGACGARVISSVTRVFSPVSDATGSRVR